MNWVIRDHHDRGMNGPIRCAKILSWKLSFSIYKQIDKCISVLRILAYREIFVDSPRQ